MKLALFVCALVLVMAACGGQSNQADKSTAASQSSLIATEVALAIRATGTAQQASSTVSVDTPTPTAVVATSTAAITTVATATAPATLIPTRTPTMVSSDVPMDLGSLLTSEHDVYGEFVIQDEREVDSSLFVWQSGFKSGRQRHLTEADPPIELIATCGEYDSSYNAMVALQDQFTTAMTSNDPYILSEDNHSSIRAQKGYLAVGMMSDQSRPVAIAWYQYERAICSTIVLGVPGSEGAPRGGAIDAANGVLKRLEQAAAPTPTAIPSGPGIYDIGETVRFGDSLSFTVLTVEDPVIVDGEPASPKTSFVLTAVELKACLSSSSKDAFVSPLGVSLSIEGNSRAERSYRLTRVPEFPTATLFQDECLQGWITFERHWSNHPTYVNIEMIGYEPFRVRAR